MSSQLALVDPFPLEEMVPKAQRKVHAMANMNGQQLSPATRDYLSKMLDSESSLGPGDGKEGMEAYYRILYKNRIAAAEAANITGQAWKKILMRDRLRMKLVSKHH